MPYTPIQPRIYTAAFVGSITGMGLSSIVANTPDNVGYVTVAGAFAQQFDIMWDLPAPTALDIALIEQLAMQLWKQQPPTISNITKTPSQYTAKCRGMIRLVESAQVHYLAEGITAPGLGGASAIDVNSHDIELASGVFSTMSTVYTRVGARTLDMSKYPVVLKFTRSVRLVCSAEKTGGSTSTDLRLIDLTNNATVVELNTLSTASQELISAPLTVGAASGNVRNDMITTYAIQIRRTGGTVDVDAAILTNARFVISYAAV